MGCTVASQLGFELGSLVWRPRRVKKNYYLKKNNPDTIQICRLENIEHKSMKQVSYSGKISLSASRAHQSHLQFSFVVRDVFCPRFLHV